ncbi:hypothetical protein RHGRI_020754 [Rhododendron griersonianum]|uniref:Uncharacterized protein n=1 Tax=Rhododendron griersonianum TaxID=479676 RepID=A0AAV6JKJ7_9ERIC|nr:hypothetical protein RHGRI_020754 [Rhododendron griersonianum]
MLSHPTVASSLTARNHNSMTMWLACCWVRAVCYRGACLGFLTYRSMLPSLFGVYRLRLQSSIDAGRWECRECFDLRDSSGLEPKANLEDEWRTKCCSEYVVVIVVFLIPVIYDIGLKALEVQAKSKNGRGISEDAEDFLVPIVRIEEDMFILVDDVLQLLERVALEPLPPKDDKGPQNRMKDCR